LALSCLSSMSRSILLSWVALYIFTGILTRPKPIAPDQIARIAFYILIEGIKSIPGTRTRICRNCRSYLSFLIMTQTRICRSCLSFRIMMRIQRGATPLERVARHCEMHPRQIFLIEQIRVWSTFAQIFIPPYYEQCKSGHQWLWPHRPAGLPPDLQ